MIKRASVVIVTLIIAFSVLFVSVLRTASVKYSFYGESASLEDEYLNQENTRLLKENKLLQKRSEELEAQLTEITKRTEPSH